MKLVVHVPILDKAVSVLLHAMYSPDNYKLILGRAGLLNFCLSNSVEGKFWF